MAIDTSLVGATPPPRKRAANARTAAAPAPKVEASSSLTDRRREGVLGLGQIAQTLCLMFGQKADAVAIGHHFPPIAQELAVCAESNDTIAKPIDMLLEVGPYGALVAAILPFGLQIAANHGWINATGLTGQGVVPPAVLEAQANAQLAQMQTQAMQQQQKAVMDAQRAQNDFEQMMREEQSRMSEAMAA